MIDKEIVKKVANIAKLNLTEEEIEKFSKELEEIEKAFSKIKEVDTEGVEPAFHPIDLENSMREDEPEEGFTEEETFSNTEHREGKYFKGPRIV